VTTFCARMNRNLDFGAMMSYFAYIEIISADFMVGHLSCVDPEGPSVI
jgi:hypothetical protein